MILQKELGELAVGDTLPSFEKPAITKVQLVKYAGASGDFNPLHTDDAFAQSVGMNGVIAHGMLVMGFLGDYVMQFASDQLAVKSFSMRFGAMTVPGDIITCGGVVESVDKGITCQLTATNHHGNVVGHGKVVFQEGLG